MKGQNTKTALAFALAVAICLISCNDHAAEKAEEKIIEKTIDKGVEKLEEGLNIVFDKARDYYKEITGTDTSQVPYYERLEIPQSKKKLKEQVVEHKGSSSVMPAAGPRWACLRNSMKAFHPGLAS